MLIHAAAAAAAAADDDNDDLVTLHYNAFVIYCAFNGCCLFLVSEFL